eukprot:CAMPEP_0175048290 /NCGR_PEP_ID=MMETSP0052_2-20121109/6109_1 /TAXON_ID=51329 ORGANISM="Polytomella parva, Strain SAG 63-3" /NCGR_SAMPLE_ID=MMETSP0052_2 /ASSEMBLY_ACC=CAM_ASM_000194 /LENGTH=33 /DNA_ID= /DNA_START= /DNA_END= /DNA_ORIENTATION=
MEVGGEASGEDLEAMEAMVAEEESLAAAAAAAA